MHYWHLIDLIAHQTPVFAFLIIGFTFRLKSFFTQKKCQKCPNLNSRIQTLDRFAASVFVVIFIDWQIQNPREAGLSSILIGLIYFRKRTHRRWHFLKWCIVLNIPDICHPRRQCKNFKVRGILVCNFTYSVYFCTQCEILHTVCNFTHSVITYTVCKFTNSV